MKSKTPPDQPEASEQAFWYSGTNKQTKKENPNVLTCFVCLTEKSGYSNEKMHNVIYLFFFPWPTLFMLTGAFGLWGELVQSVMPGFGLCGGPWRCCGGAGGRVGAGLGRGFRGAAAWWCGTGGDWAPRRAQLDEATAPNGCARFWAAGPEPVRLLPRSVEEGEKNRTALIFRREQNERDIYILWTNELFTLIYIMLTYK